MEEKIRQKLRELMKAVEEDGRVDKIALSRFDKAIAEYRDMGIKIHEWETISRCYHEILKGMDYRIYGVSCEDDLGGMGR